MKIADILRRHGAAWRAAQAGHVGLGQLTVMSATETCRDRHCPKCQGAAAREWLAAREADLLPVG